MGSYIYMYIYTSATVPVHFYNYYRTVPLHVVLLSCLSSPDIDDLFVVSSELLDVAHNWKSLGLALRLKPSLLSRIQKDCSDVKDCLVELLTEWLNKAYNTARFGDPTWQLLVAAVAHPLGGNNPALAQHIATKYNGECVMLHEGIF